MGAYPDSTACYQLCLAGTFDHAISMRRMMLAGDERPGTTPADLVFVIEERPHQKFSREGNDLVYSAKLPLVDALCGATVKLTSLDGRPLTVCSLLHTCMWARAAVATWSRMPCQPHKCKALYF